MRPAPTLVYPDSPIIAAVLAPAVALTADIRHLSRSNNTVTQVTSRAMLFPPIVRWEHRIATNYSTMSNTAQAIWKDGSDHVLAARPTADASEGRPDTCAGSTRKAVHPQLEVLSSC